MIASCIAGGRAALALAAVLAVAADITLYKLWRGDEFTGLVLRGVAALSFLTLLMGLRLSGPRDHGLTLGGSGDWPWIATLSTVVFAATVTLAALGITAARLAGMAPPVEEFHPLLDFTTEAQLRRYLLVGLVLAPIIEELVYRALAVPGLAAVFGTRGAILLSGPLFYALHVIYLRQWFLFHYVIAGWLLSWAFVRRGKLWVAMVLHALVWLAPDFVRSLLGHA